MRPPPPGPIANRQTVEAYLRDHSPRCIDEDARFTDHAAGTQVSGPDEIGAALYDWYHVAFSQTEARVRRLTAGDDAVTLEFTFVGCNTGPRAGRPPTGKRVELAMCAVYGLVRGMIRSIDLYYDRTTLDRQLGRG
jgi:predicted ester cyclase